MKVVALGVGGLVLAVTLSLGAFALAGRSLSEPGTAVQIPGPGVSESPKSERSPSSGHTPGLTPAPETSSASRGTGAETPTGNGTGGETETESESPDPSSSSSPDDHGGAQESEPGDDGDGHEDD